MSNNKGYQWLIDKSSGRADDLEKHRDWFREWQPAMRRQLSGTKLERLTGDQFSEILLEMQNRWSTLARLKTRLASPRTWPTTHNAFLVLADEKQHLQDRLDVIKPPDGTLPVPHLSQAVITAFLHLRYPEKYCIWNGRARKGMKTLGLWPSFPRGATFAEKYLLINATVLKCSRDTGLSLPDLDILWWWAEEDLQDSPLNPQEDPAGLEGGLRIMQERTKRDAAIVRKAKLRWSDGNLVSPACVVCGWAMDDVYGDDGFGFIEAHHNDPLGNSNKQRVTRIEDLSPVCPNCHAILHRSGKSMQELKSVIKANGMAGF